MASIFDIYLCLCHHYQYQKSPIIKQDLDRSSPECKDAHLVGEMEFSRSIEVEDGVEGSRVAIKEELVLDDRIIAAEGDDLLVGSSSGEKAQS